MLTDTHAHFDAMLQPDNPLAAIMKRAEQAGVTRILAVGSSPTANLTALQAARDYPAEIRAAVGYNRDRANNCDSMQDLQALIAEPATAAIGEIGLDFQQADTDIKAQTALFRKMLELARSFGKPVIIHTRNAEVETLAALREHAAAWPTPGRPIGVMHCFTGTPEFARATLALGFMLSFSGIITFKNAAAIRAVAAQTPEDRILIETDAPYLAPEPLRGRSNEPAFLRHTAACLAQIKRMPLDAIASITARNAANLFF